MKILMVCLGNICRSPLAEGILRQKIEQAGLNWQVDSAGTGNYHPGSAPHHLSQKTALARGINISRQKARQFNKTDIAYFDKIYVMDTTNYEDVKIMSGDQWNNLKVDLLMNEWLPGTNTNVPDPYFGGEDGFEQVYNMIDKACAAIVQRYSQPVNNLFRDTRKVS